MFEPPPPPMMLVTRLCIGHPVTVDDLDLEVGGTPGAGHYPEVDSRGR